MVTLDQGRGRAAPQGQDPARDLRDRSGSGGERRARHQGPERDARLGGEGRLRHRGRAGRGRGGVHQLDRGAPGRSRGARPGRGPGSAPERRPPGAAGPTSSTRHRVGVADEPPRRHHGRIHEATRQALSRRGRDLAQQAGQVRDLAEAVQLVKQTAHAKFDETIVVSSHLGVDPRHSDQLVRGTVVLPHGTGKSLRVLVLTKGEKEKEAAGGRAPISSAPRSTSRRSRRAGWTSTRSSPRRT